MADEYDTTVKNFEPKNFVEMEPELAQHLHSVGIIHKINCSYLIDRTSRITDKVCDCVENNNGGDICFVITL